MTVALVIDAQVQRYSGGREGPLGERGIWSGEPILAGDGTGGNANLTVTLPNFSNKLAFTIDYIGFATTDGTARIAQVTLNLRLPDGVNGFVSIASAVTLGTGASTSAIINPISTIFSPVGPDEPNLLLAVGNPGAGINVILRAWGRIYPNMYVNLDPAL